MELCAELKISGGMYKTQIDFRFNCRKRWLPIIKYEDECVGCPPEIGCLHSACKYQNVPHYYCDKCGDEDKLYDYDGEQLCKSCLLGNFKVVEGSE